ncbi:hypothetical protein [Clostridium isatidis]|uniref:Uncharacterized protein n=1 Tax=Clostridium isatidis TaxID=182773 RepID=A0A343JFR5_9CLOT|nr:hypothetical protein [Clostridium isatidis]ASW44373.1 hypothetical protein BEN51_13315 [Clostridium isatidis]
MIIKDKEGIYELKVDLDRKVVTETYEKKLFTKEAVTRMAEDYRNKIFPLFKGKKWAKLCDMRNYMMTQNVPEAQEFVGECYRNGMDKAALIVATKVLEMQMNRVGEAQAFKPVAFTDPVEADNYLKSAGY